MASNAQQFPQQNQPFTIPVAFVDGANNTIKSWTGAASQVFIDGANGIVGNAPVESLDSTNSPAGYGLLQLTAAQMNGQLIGVSMTITNSGATTTTEAVYTDPGFVPGVRPTTMLGYMRWLFQYFFGGGNLARGNGFQQVLNDDGTLLTQIQISGTETNFIKGKSTP
jgi:hypothetical protein